MRHVIVGSAGFLGRHLLSALPGAEGFDLPDFDVRNRGDCNSLPLTGATVWHLAAVNSSTQSFYDEPERVLDVQIRGTMNMLDACADQGAHTFVLFSSSEVFQDAPLPTPEKVRLVVPDIGNPRFSYGGSKIAAELMVQWSPLPRCLTLRPFNVFGPGQGRGHVIADLAARIAAAEAGATVPVYGRPGDTRAFCYVDDFIAGALTAERLSVEPREVYHVGTEQETALALLVTYLAYSMGRTDVKFEFQGGPPGAVSRRCPDTRKLRALGWEPRHTMADGLAKTIAWYREQKQ